MKPIINKYLPIIYNTNVLKILFFVGTLIISFIETSGSSDFLIYQHASQDVVHHINPYNHPYIDGYYYYYSIFFAYLIFPFTYLPAYWSTFLWLIFNSYLLYLIIYQISDFVDVSKYNKKFQSLFYFLLILFNMRTIRENYHSAQITIFILFLMIYSLKFILKKQYILSSILLALAINIKLLALPLMFYYLYRGYWKTFIFTITFTVLLFVIPYLWLPHSFYINCMKDWLNLINPSNNKHLIDVDERSFHGITTLLTTLFIKHPPDIYALPIRRYIVDLNVQQVITIIQISRIILIASVLYVIRSLPFQSCKNKMCLFYEASYIMALIPLIFPHQQHYAFLLQMPAISILILLAMQNAFNIYHKIFLLIIFLGFNLKIIFGMLNNYYDHFKILTYAGLLVVGLMIYFKTKFNCNNHSFSAPL